jgi:ATP-dependent RNA helicase DeaD
LLAVVCRRGGVRGSDVGAIRIEAAHSLVDIAAPVADGFESRAAEPDPRDSRVQITRMRFGAGEGSHPERRPPARPSRPHRSPPTARHGASGPVGLRRAKRPE